MQSGKGHAALSGGYPLMVINVKNIAASVHQRLLNTKLINAPVSFEEVMAAAKLFLKPLAFSIIEQRAFKSNWTAPGPWR